MDLSFLGCVWMFMRNKYTLILRGPLGFWVYLGPDRKSPAGFDPESVNPELINGDPPSRQLEPPED